MLLILVSIEHWSPHAPAPLIAVGSGIAGVSLFGLQAYGVRTVGQVPTGLPPLTPPDFSLILQLWPAAVGIALMSFTETIAAGLCSEDNAVSRNLTVAAEGDGPVRAGQKSTGCKPREDHPLDGNTL